MAIEKMKRLSLYAMVRDREALLAKLQRLGCVDVSQPDDLLTNPACQALVRPDMPESEELLRQTASVNTALALLEQYAPVKSSLLQALPQVPVQELFDGPALAAALDTAETLCQYGQRIAELTGRISQLQTQLSALAPWLTLDLPLNQTETRQVSIQLLTIPASEPLAEVFAALEGAAEESALYEISTDRDLHYLLLLCHKTQTEQAAAALKPFGASHVSFKDCTASAGAETARLTKLLEQYQLDRQQAADRVTALADSRQALKLCADRLSQDLARQQIRSRLCSTGSAFTLEGWVPQADVAKLEKLLSTFDCAWELRDPDPEEIPQVPVKLKNNILTRCMNVVTEMYSLPAYDGVDPNPLMAPFFIVFFGIMMADMAYGLLMMVAGWVVLKRSRPRPGTRNFMELVFLCGISTFIMGALTGGFFGDFIPQLLRVMNPNSSFEMPCLFNPLDDTMAIMLGSLVLGVIQIFTGMTVSMIEKIKAGDFLDALFSEITWWVILGGVALMALGIGNVSGIPVVLIIGCLMLVFGGTRNARGFGKVTSLVGLVYNGVTGYFGDILSYVRLMALMLSGSVIAQVFNTLGAVFGNVFAFILVSMIGNALNLALNLLGCYVHDLRLQCLEFFNRFYKEGGVPYNPLAIQTTSVDVIKEEQ